jgi:hypothetical protein
MTRAFRNLIERQILKARSEGKLSGLEGEGAPLPGRPEAAHMDAGLAAGMRMMAEAGVVPPEFSLKEQLDAARSAYVGLTDPEEKRRAMARIADLEMRFNMARDARRKFLS